MMEAKVQCFFFYVVVFALKEAEIALLQISHNRVNNLQ